MLVIETGSVIPGANSFITADDARGLGSSDYSFSALVGIEDDDLEPKLVAAYHALTQHYDNMLSGYRVEGATGLFPRYFCYSNAMKRYVLQNEIPDEVIRAQLFITAAFAGGISADGATAVCSQLIRIDTGMGGELHFSEDGIAQELLKIQNPSQHAHRLLNPFFKLESGMRL